MSGQRVKAVRPLIDKVLVEKPFFNDDIQECKSQRVIRAGPQLEPEFRSFSQFRFSWIDDDELGPVFDPLQEQAADLSFFIRAQRVTSPEHDQFARVMEVRNRVEPAGVNPGHLTGRVTDVLDADHIG